LYWTCPDDPAGDADTTISPDPSNEVLLIVLIFVPLTNVTCASAAVRAAAASAAVMSDLPTDVVSITCVEITASMLIQKHSMLQ
jgi:hypothetical protein